MKIDSRITYDLVEMLQLRAIGWRHQELAKKYNRERTTLLHQCKKWGVEPGAIVSVDAEGTPIVLGYDPKIITVRSPNASYKAMKESISKKVVVPQPEKDLLILPTPPPPPDPPKPPKYADLFEEDCRFRTYKDYLREAKKRPIEARYMREHRLDWSQASAPPKGGYRPKASV